MAENARWEERRIRMSDAASSAASFATTSCAAGVVGGLEGFGWTEAGVEGWRSEGREEKGLRVGFWIEGGGRGVGLLGGVS